MFYGSLDNNKLLRPLRKYYSADGSMEIKHNIQTGAVEFVTYIGGDGYSAPIVLKSDGTTQNYLYLQRDYQGSIVAISDATGNVLEKRLFDAWGNVLVQNGAGNVLNGLSLLDRGYTGHEHLQSVGLIHMNGRLYDAKLHRFLQPDNYVQDPGNTQNYNRYGYVLNNPLKYVDFCGECYEDNDPDDYDPTCDPPIGQPQQNGTFYDDGNGNVWIYNGATETWEGQTPGATNTYNNVVPLYEITITGTGSSSFGWSNGTESFYNSAYSSFIQGGGGGSISQSSSSGADIINGFTGTFLTALDDYAQTNAQLVYRYGAKGISAAALTEANAARMLGIAKKAQVLGNTLGFISGAYSLTQAYNEFDKTGNINYQAITDGTISIAGASAGTAMMFGVLASNPVGWAVLGGIATGAAIYGVYTFGRDVYNYR